MKHKFLYAYFLYPVSQLPRASRKKSYFLNGRAIKRGGGGKEPAIEE